MSITDEYLTAIRESVDFEALARVTGAAYGQAAWLGQTNPDAAADLSRDIRRATDLRHLELCEELAASTRALCARYAAEQDADLAALMAAVT